MQEFHQNKSHDQVQIQLSEYKLDIYPLQFDNTAYPKLRKASRVDYFQSLFNLSLLMYDRVIISEPILINCSDFLEGFFCNEIKQCPDLAYNILPVMNQTAASWSAYRQQKLVQANYAKEAVDYDCFKILDQHLSFDRCEFIAYDPKVVSNNYQKNTEAIFRNDAIMHRIGFDDEFLRTHRNTILNYIEHCKKHGKFNRTSLYDLAAIPIDGKIKSEAEFMEHYSMNNLEHRVIKELRNSHFRIKRLSRDLMKCVSDAAYSCNIPSTFDMPTSALKEQREQSYYAIRRDVPPEWSAHLSIKSGDSASVDLPRLPRDIFCIEALKGLRGRDLLNIRDSQTFSDLQGAKARFYSNPNNSYFYQDFIDAYIRHGERIYKSIGDIYAGTQLFREYLQLRTYNYFYWLAGEQIAKAVGTAMGIPELASVLVDSLSLFIEFCATEAAITEQYVDVISNKSIPHDGDYVSDISEVDEMSKLIGNENNTTFLQTTPVSQ